MFLLVLATSLCMARFRPQIAGKHAQRVQILGPKGHLQTLTPNSQAVKWELRAKVARLYGDDVLESLQSVALPAAWKHQTKRPRANLQCLL